MPDRSLIDDAITQADRAIPPIRAAARLHIARVLTAFDKDEARRVLQSALDEIQTLDLNPFDRSVLEREAHMLTAAVAPDLAINMAKNYGRAMSHDKREFGFIHVLLAYGHLNTAIKYLLSYNDPASYPYDFIPTVMRECTDPGVKLALLRSSIQAWRNSSTIQSPLPPNRLFMGLNDFVGLFAYHWTLIDSAEAIAITRDLVAQISELPDLTIQASFDPVCPVEFTSLRQYQFFELLHVIRRLDPALADFLLARNSELSAAANYLPWGQESVQEAQTKYFAAQNTNQPAGKACIIMDSGSEMPFHQALAEGKNFRQFEPAFIEALNLLAADTQSNDVILECWPSSQAFRNLLYEAGKTLGTEGAAFLKRVPDADLRLFAQVEFAAALAGLPNYSGRRATRHVNRRS